MKRSRKTVPNSRLKEQRLFHNWTQAEVAQKIGTTNLNVSRWELGVTFPGLYFRQKLIELFGKSAQELGLLQETEDNHGDETSRLAQGKEERASSTIAFPEIWYVANPRNPFFTGREATLHSLHTILSQQKTAALTHSFALSGLGGIGKTQTALEYAYRYAQHYSAILWVGGESHESLISGFSSIAKLLKLTEGQDQDQNQMVSSVVQWLNTHQNWLLIIDNVEEIEMIKPFLPTAGPGSLLFTTQMQALGTLAPGIEMRQMTPEEGAWFLLRRAKLEDVSVSQDQLTPEKFMLARTISEVLGGLPLALDQAGAYIEETQCSLSDFFGLYQDYSHRLLDARSTRFEHPLSVMKTFALSFEKIQQIHPEAADLLIMCSFLAPEAIPETLMTDGALYLGPVLQPLISDLFQFNVVLKTLLNYSLLSRHNRAITLHRLVQAVIREQVADVDQRIWIERITQAIHVLFPVPTIGQIAVEHYALCEQLLPHALACISWNEQKNLFSPELVSLLTQVAAYLHDRARYTDAETLYLRARNLQEKIGGAHSPEIVAISIRLAELSYKQGKYGEAEAFYQKIISDLDQYQKPDVLQIASSLNGLAVSYMRQGKYGRAEVFYRQALKLREKAVGEIHPAVATVLNNLALLFHLQGRYKEAEPLFLRALRIREMTEGSDHINLTFPLNNLASLYVSMEQYKEAEPLLQRALLIREKVQGPNHPDIASPLTHLAQLYDKQSRYEEAQSLYQRALHIVEEKLGSEHFDIIYPLQGLAELYLKVGRDEEAEILFHRVWRVLEQVNPERYEIAYPLQGLAKISIKQNKYELAEHYCQRALDLWEKSGVRHPDRAECYWIFGTIRQAEGHTEEAEKFFEQARTFQRGAEQTEETVRSSNE